MAHGDFKDLKRRTFSEKVLRDKAFNIAKNPKYDGYQRGLASMVYKFFNKKSKGSGVNIEVKHNEQLAKELHRPIIRNVNKRAVYSGFKDHIWGANFTDTQLISQFNKGFRFLLCLLIVLVNMHGLFLREIEKVLVLLILFKKYQMIQIENQTKYGLIKEVNFTIILLKNG